MGAISSCCKKDYAALPDGAEGSEFSGVAKDEAHVPDSYNQTLSPFTGLTVELKFTSKSGYEEKFVWLNSTSKTIHMSTHSTKEKRHKEASLADVSVLIGKMPLFQLLEQVTSVVAGPPVKSKHMTDGDKLCCLTVNFKRGGGIDLRFQSQKIRDEWNDMLNKLVKVAKK